jgi:MFS family permease
MNKKILLAAIVGSVFEWYDFYLFATLLMFMSKVILPVGNDTLTFLFGLIMFGVGVIVRPFGALFFGRLSDLAGRKKVFLTTVIMMGIFTTAMGLLPGFAMIGWVAPILLIVCRIGQGLALGGEYGNAIAYIYEHVKKESRGVYTGLVQTSVHFGLLLTFTIVLLCQWSMTAAEFADWGWRIPFVFSLILIILSVWLRRSMDESPEYLAIANNNQLSKSPIIESFTNRHNLKHAIIVTLGVTAGMSVVVYTTVAYMIMYLLKVMKLDPTLTMLILGGSQIFAILLTAWLGKLSDKVSKLKMLVFGLLLSGVTIVPLFGLLDDVIHPDRNAVISQYPIRINGPDNCSLNLFSAQTTDCAKVKDLFIKNNIPFSNNITQSIDGVQYEITLNNKSFNASNLSAITTELKNVGYINVPTIMTLESKLLIFALVCFAMILHSLTFAPVAALLGDLFPTKIRSTSISTVFHFSIGWFGGFLPFIVTILNAMTGSVLFGLYYPSIVALISAGIIFIFNDRLSK